MHRRIWWRVLLCYFMARDLEEPSMEVTVRNVPIIFSPDELARFLGYERDLAVFPNLSMSKEGRPTKTKIFRTMLGKDTTILDGAYLIYRQLCPFWWIMHLILCSAIDPRKHTTELSYSRAEFLYLVVVRGLPVDMTSYIYQFVRAEALKTYALNSLPHGILLTQFLHAMLVPEGADEPRAIPLGSINKTTLSKSIAQTRRALNAARVLELDDRSSLRRQWSSRILDRARPRDLGHNDRVGWMTMMTQLTEWMQSVLLPTHEMVSDISVG
ncbi:hypothetical protein CJ030_MR7G022909 [Morella rubra]|uniref:Uncharacterized protein n=1 Tax=Morella rubra TaxID=262757 RepID=A0A6A1V717_9ROSI|nr:hypothetical protein CJ030_MR7G022909 [Morella rubra]